MGKRRNLVSFVLGAVMAIAVMVAVFAVLGVAVGGAGASAAQGAQLTEQDTEAADTLGAVIAERIARLGNDGFHLIIE